MPASSHDEIRRRLRALALFAGPLPAFDPAAAPEHPAVLFCDWLGDAIDAELHEPHAMTLSTVDWLGHPNARVLTLRGVDLRHWHFASTRTSRKGEELAANPSVAMTFYWSDLGRQVRLRGRVSDAGQDAGARDFLARPEASRAATLVGNQSEVLAERDELDTALDRARGRIVADPRLVDDAWALYHLIPDEIEFWQAAPDRRHVRLRYVLIDDGWVREQLWP